MTEENGWDQREYDRKIRRVAKGGGVDVLGRIIAKGIGSVAAPVTSRLLGASAYGLYFVATQAVSLLALLLRMGYPSAILRFVGVYDGEGKPREGRAVVSGSVLVALAFSAVLTALLVLWPGLVADSIYGKPQMTPVLRIAALSLPARVVFILMVFGTLARGTTFYRAVGNIVCYSTLLAGVIVFCDVFNFSAQGAAYASLLSFTAATAVALVGLHRLYGPLRFGDIRWSSLVEVALFALPLLLSQISQYGLFRINPVIGGIWLSDAALGKYGAASMVAVVGTFGLDALGQIFSPVMADLNNRGKTDALREMFSTTTRWSYYFTIPVMMIAVFKADDVLRIFGPEFADAALLLRILCIGQLVSISVGPAGYGLIMTDHQWLSAVDNIVMAVGNIVLCVLLVQWLDVIGLALAAMVATVGVNLLRATQLWKLHGISAWTWSAVKPVLLTIPLLPLLLITLQPWWLDLIVGSVLFTMAFVAAIYLVGLAPDDREVMRAIRRRLSRGG